MNKWDGHLSSSNTKGLLDNKWRLCQHEAEALRGQTAALCLKLVQKSSTFSLWEFTLGSVSSFGLTERERERDVVVGVGDVRGD